MALLEALEAGNSHHLVVGNQTLAFGCASWLKASAAIVAELVAAVVVVAVAAVAAAERLLRRANPISL